METLWQTFKRCTSQVCVAIGIDTEPETDMKGGSHNGNTLADIKEMYLTSVCGYWYRHRTRNRHERRVSQWKHSGGH